MKNVVLNQYTFFASVIPLLYFSSWLRRNLKYALGSHAFTFKAMS